MTKQPSNQTAKQNNQLNQHCLTAQGRNTACHIATLASSPFQGLITFLRCEVARALESCEGETQRTKHLRNMVKISGCNQGCKICKTLSVLIFDCVIFVGLFLFIVLLSLICVFWVTLGFWLLLTSAAGSPSCVGSVAWRS